MLAYFKISESRQAEKMLSFWLKILWSYSIESSIDSSENAFLVHFSYNSIGIPFGYPYSSFLIY